MDDIIFLDMNFYLKQEKGLEIFCSQLRYNTLIILLEFFSLILVNLSSDVFHKPQMIMYRKK